VDFIVLIWNVFDSIACWGILKKKITSCKLTRSLTHQFPNSHQLNHHIIAASFVEKGSHTGQAIRNDGFFFVRQ
jgi:hypothetical protein